MVYVFNLALIFLYAFVLRCCPLEKKTKDIVFLVLCSTQFVLIAGTRTPYSGVDTYTYYTIFAQIHHYRNPLAIPNRDMELLYCGLCWIIGHLGLSFAFVNFVMAALTMIFLSKAIYRMSRNVFFSIFLFVAFSLFQQMMGQYRQILALAIFLYALSLWIEGKKTETWIYLLLASGFHISVWSVIPLFFMANVKLTKRTVFLYFLAAAIALLSMNAIYSLLLHTPYANYVGSIYDVIGQRSTILNLLVRLALLIFVGYFYQTISKKREDIDVFYHMALCCTALQILTTRSSLFGRITTYYFSAYLVLIPEIVVKGYKKVENRQILSLFLLVMFLLWYYVYFHANLESTHYESYLFG